MPGGKKAESEEAAAKKKYSRRDFLVTGGTVVAVDALIATTPAKAVAATSPSPAAVKYPASKGYLVYDSKKCIGLHDVHAFLLADPLWSPESVALAHPDHARLLRQIPQ